MARCTFEIIREAVTNSVKHGSADEVLIRLGVNRELKLEVLNNGKPAPKLTGYAGEELFDQLCLSHQIENREGKVVLEALLALSPEDQQQYQI